MKTLLVLTLCGAAALAQTAPPPKAAPKPAPPSSALMTPAALKAKAPELFHVKFVTTHGDFVVEVHRDWAPLGADRFYNLVKNRFFTDAAFFRYVPNFIVQFGLPANPAVSAVWEKATFKDDPVKQSNKRGTIVFATAGANTRTTQFFINLRDNGASLDGQGFAPFGTVTEGMDIVQGLYSGYGEDADMGGHGPRQTLVSSQGKAYLDKNFPKLDYIKSAVVMASAAPSEAPKK